jgi:hypothetical protein
MSRRKKRHDKPDNEILEVEKHVLSVEERILGVEERELRILEEIEHDLHHKPNVTGVKIHQIGNPMALLAIAPGNSPQFQATVTPTGAATVAAQGVWASSDSVNAPVTQNTSDATGLTATVNIPTSAVAGTAFTLSFTYTNADGTSAVGDLGLVIASSGTATNVTGVSIAQIV